MKNSTKKNFCAIMLVIMVAGTALAYVPTYLSGGVTVTHAWKYYGEIKKQNSGSTQIVTFSEGYGSAEYYKVKPQAILVTDYVDVGNAGYAYTNGSGKVLSINATLNAGTYTRVGYTLNSSDPDYANMTSDSAYIRYDFY